MMDTFDDLMRRASSLPREAQAELADVIAELEERYRGIYRLTETERAAIERGLEAMRDGRYACPEDVAATLAKARAGG